MATFLSEEACEELKRLDLALAEAEFKSNEAAANHAAAQAQLSSFALRAMSAIGVHPKQHNLCVVCGAVISRKDKEPCAHPPRGEK